MKRIGFAISLAAIMAVVISPVSKADDYLVNNLESCNSSNAVNCTASVVAVFPNGNRVTAVPTGKHNDGNCAGLNGLSHSCSFNEWKVSGLKNEDGSDLIQTTGWIQPPSQSSNSRLPPGGILFFVAASGWVGQKKIQSPKCLDSRYNCNSSYDLQPDVSFEVTIRENSMQPAYTTGTLDGGKVFTSQVSGEYSITYSGRAGKTAGILASPIPGDETVPNKPDWDQQLWSIRTIDAKESDGLGVHGIDCHGANPSLMTDALWVGLPNFDSSAKDVSLDVNNPHFDVNGNVASGHFQAYFPKEFTECYWGLDAKSSASKASVSITEDGGVTDVSTLSVTADSAGLTISANGFHYSSPHISIKLPDDVKSTSGSQAPQPVVAKILPAVPAKKVSITCVKKKVKKVITGVNPQCPTGFRKA